MLFLWENCRHGVRQIRSAWADGPAYITQCPIQTGQSYTYNFTITGQRGTLLWHAHISWLRATLYGPIIILPKRNESYPFDKPYREIPILFGNSIPSCLYITMWYYILENISRYDLKWCSFLHGFLDFSGEWFNVDPEAVIKQALQTGAGPNVSDAYTINGLPGPLYNCSSKGTKRTQNFQSS